MRNFAGSLPGMYLMDPRTKYVKRMREQSTDTSPIQHWTQGLSRLGKALFANIIDKQARGDLMRAMAVRSSGDAPQGDPVAARGNAIRSTDVGEVPDEQLAQEMMQDENAYHASVGGEINDPNAMLQGGRMHERTLSGLSPYQPVPSGQGPSGPPPAGPAPAGGAGASSSLIEQYRAMPNNIYAQAMLQGELDRVRNKEEAWDQFRRQLEFKSHYDAQAKLADRTYTTGEREAKQDFEKREAALDRTARVNVAGSKDTRSTNMKDYAAAKTGGYTGTFDEYVSKMKKLSKPENQINIDTAEKGFTKLAQTMAKNLSDQQIDVEGAVIGLRALHESEKIFKEGIITGKGAKWMTEFGSFLSSRMGITYFDDPVANTQAFAATMGTQVGQIIKQFGAGTGLSDADREYAEKIVGGNITVNEKAIRRLMAINKKAFTNVIKAYNFKADQVMSKPEASALPYDLRVPMPEFDTPSGGGNVPEGVDPEDWKYMTPEEKKVFQ